MSAFNKSTEHHDGWSRWQNKAKKEKRRKEIETIQIGKKEIQLFSLTVDMILYIENPRGEKKENLIL